MRSKWIFDWSCFNEEDLRECNSQKGNFEDEIYGSVHLEHNDNKYYIDIHYEYYSSKECGFDLEIFKEKEDGTHGKWIESIKTIKSASSYKRFCTRVENKIIEFFNKEV